MEIRLNLAPREIPQEAEKLALDPRSKLRIKTTGTYKVIHTMEHSVTIGIEGVDNTVSIDRVPPEPHQDPSDKRRTSGQEDETGSMEGKEP